MLYEVRTYNIKVGKVAAFEARFGARHPYRQKHSKLGAFWHTDIGPLDQVVHAWEYDSLEQREQVRIAAENDPDLKPLPSGRDLSLEQWSELMIPAPFMEPLSSQDYGIGNIYEMCAYIFESGEFPKVLKAWSKPATSSKGAPLAASWYTEFGTLNKCVNVWVYRDPNQRAGILSNDWYSYNWPLTANVKPMRQESKILIPASFSPVR